MKQISHPAPTAAAAAATDVTDAWWRGAVIYQVYPRSYQDSNGDGIGDLNGIVKRLPYIASLGVDAVWISPFFQSPMKDFGYDVSDYRAIHPMFGDLDAFDKLLATARELGLKVMIDLVLSHTSDQHPWFKESCQDRDNPKADWYVWAPPKPDGTPPNNWLSVFGGPAWQWHGKRQQYYLHNFLVAQPDLNFHNREVQDAVLDVARFWLERGVDGFRLDTVNFYFHDHKLRDNPPLELARRNEGIAPQVNPYNYQDHLYSKNRPENLDFLARFRAVLDEYGATTSLGEVGDAQRGIELMGQYTAGDTRAHMCYSFELLGAQPASAAWVRDAFARLDKQAPNAWACWAYSNHDVARHVSRWGLNAAAIRAYIVLLMALRGSACVYQGEELGLEEAEVPFESLQDPYGIEFWPAYKGRDGCRTPMVWENDGRFGGFSAAAPWLPVAAAHLPKAVAAQEADAGALLHHYRAAIQLRKQHPALALGAMTDIKADGDVLTFERVADERLFCAFNLSNDAAQVALPHGEWTARAASGSVAGEQIKQTFKLGDWGYLVASKRG